MNIVSLLYLAINALFVSPRHRHSVVYVKLTKILQLFVLVDYPSGPPPQITDNAVLKLSVVLNGLENNSTIARGSSIAPLFFSNSEPAIRCWGVLTAVSALGELKDPGLVEMMRLTSDLQAALSQLYTHLHASSRLSVE